MTVPCSASHPLYTQERLPIALPELQQFCTRYPIPTDTNGLAQLLADLITIFLTTQFSGHRTSPAHDWKQLGISLGLRNYPTAHPGAFLSNPHFLPSFTTAYGHGALGGGCFFSYPHYHEHHVCQALFLAAFSERTQSSLCPASAYARALIHLLEHHYICGLEIGLNYEVKKTHGIELQVDPSIALSDQMYTQLHAQRLTQDQFYQQLDQCRYERYYLKIDARQFHRYRFLTHPHSLHALTLALTDTHMDSFSVSRRARLVQLLQSSWAQQESTALEQSCAPISSPLRSERFL